jgi:hypothetical protein
MTEYNIGDHVYIEVKNNHCAILEKTDSGKYDEESNSSESVIINSGTITCKYGQITEHDLKEINAKDLEIFHQNYLNQVVYCVHLDDLEEFSPKVYFMLPLLCPEHKDEYICSKHGGKDKNHKSWLMILSFTCYLAAV